MPVSFGEYLETPEYYEDYELFEGKLIPFLGSPLDHEMLSCWLKSLLFGYASAKKLGTVLGSRTLIKIDEWNGRLPDLLFVRQERLDILDQKALRSAPDLIVEIASPNDSAQHLEDLQTDYCTIGTAEIVVIYPQKKRIAVLRKRDENYLTEEIGSGDKVTLESLNGLTLEADWLLDPPHPEPFETLMQLLK